MSDLVRCRGCRGGKAIRHRADLCAECLERVDPALVDAYIEEAMKLNRSDFDQGAYEKASQALREALDRG